MIFDEKYSLDVAYTKLFFAVCHAKKELDEDNIPKAKEILQEAYSYAKERYAYEEKVEEALESLPYPLWM